MKSQTSLFKGNLDDVFWCTSCLNMSTRPRISFNESGECNACQWSEEKKIFNWEAQEKKLNEYERAVFIVLDLIKTSITKHKHAKKPEKILTLSFEAILVNPRKELKKISSFLGIKLDENIMEFFIKLEDLPKEYDSKKHKDKMIELENNINSDLFLDLQELQDQYNNSVYNLV